MNLASRIASYAGAGKVLASEETVEGARVEGVRFDSVGPVDLKGLTRSVTLYEVSRDPRA